MNGDIGRKSVRQPLIVRLDEEERADLERLAAMWKLPLAVTFRRVLRERERERLTRKGGG